MKFVSWNVNGLRACMNKGFMETFQTLDADIFCLQETKMQPHQLELDLPRYKQYWNSAEKKGYSGTAIFTKVEPLNVSYGLGIEEHDHEGRVITLEFDKITKEIKNYLNQSETILQKKEILQNNRKEILTFLKKYEKIETCIKDWKI